LAEPGFNPIHDFGEATPALAFHFALIRAKIALSRGIHGISQLIANVDILKHLSESLSEQETRASGLDCDVTEKPAAPCYEGSCRLS